MSESRSEQKNETVTFLQRAAMLALQALY